MLSALFAILLDIVETGIFLSDMDNLEGTFILVSLLSDSASRIWRNISNSYYFKEDTTLLGAWVQRQFKIYLVFST